MLSPFRCGLACLSLALAPLAAQTSLQSLSGTTDQAALGSAVAFGAFGTTPQAFAVGAPGHTGALGLDQGRVTVRDVFGNVLLTVDGLAAGDRFGESVALGGDVDGDGLPDLLVGAPGAGFGAGAARVLSSATGLIVHTVPGGTVGDRCGASVAFLGDLDADSRSEFAVGAPDVDGGAGVDAGRVTVHRGVDASVLRTMDGATALGNLGERLARLADVDGDGRDELVVATPNSSATGLSNAGRVTVFDPVSGAAHHTLDGTTADDNFGASVASAGDLDLDGVDDVVVGAPGTDGLAGMDAGAAVVVSGATGATLLTIDGAQAGEALGRAVAGGGDLNGDGVPDLACGAPLADLLAGADCGRVAAFSGRDGTQLFEAEGLAAGDAEGSAVAIGIYGATVHTAKLASGAPNASGGGTARGTLRLLESDTKAASRVDLYATLPQVRQAVRFDADGDGDLDLVVVSASTLSVHWNGDRAGGATRGVFADVASSDVALGLVGASAVSLAVGQFDADLACEMAVGTNDGRLLIIDGTGSLGSTAFALSGSPITVDTNPTPGALDGVAVLGTGAAAEVVCAGAGSLSFPGFVKRVSAPLGSVTVGGALTVGGTFHRVLVADLDGDTNLDIIATNPSSGADGGVHVFAGPTYAPAVGSPFAAAGVLPRTLAVLDLDGDTITDDLAVSAVGFGSGGVRLLLDYSAGAGFGGSHDPGLSLARDVATGDFDGDSVPDLVALDGAGVAQLLTGWSGASFLAPTPLPLAAAQGTVLVTGQFSSTTFPGDRDEIVAFALSSDQFAVWHDYLPAQSSVIAGTGCPPGASFATASLSTDPVLGELSIVIGLDGATPFSLVFLSAQVAAPQGVAPSVMTVSGCGLAMSSGPIYQYNSFTDGLGSAGLLSGAPNDPELIGLGYVLQWGILDGGPLLSGLTVSDALYVVFGEI